MALTQKLQIRQAQTLTMTPQLLQAIKLLQLSRQDLLQYVESELERNPLLEREQGEQSSLDAVPLEDSPTHYEADESSSDPVDSVQPTTDQLLAGEMSHDGVELIDSLDTNVGEIYPDASPSPAAVSHRGSFSGDGNFGYGDNSHSNLEEFVAQSTTLVGFVSQQMAFLPLNPAEKMIAGLLINSLDEAGYLRLELDDAADMLEVRDAEVERVLTHLQALDPPGVFARSLEECLALQLRERDRYDPAMEKLVNNLDCLARRELTALEELCDVDREDLLQMITEVKELDPKPGRRFASGPVEVVVPDVFVAEDGEGGWRVEINPDALPKILINRDYYSKVTDQARGKEERLFLSECLQSGNWLVKSLDQRAQSIIKVATEIVKQQESFFKGGVRFLRPLTLREVADAVQLHESTVSRVTANKYFSCARGIFEFKYFFSSSIASSDGGGSHSSEAVRDRIRQLIANEDPKKIFSDDALVKILKSEDAIDIARRTVTKYRESLGLGSSVQRRREKRL